MTVGKNSKTNSPHDSPWLELQGGFRDNWSPNPATTPWANLFKFWVGTAQDRAMTFFFFWLPPERGRLLAISGCFVAMTTVALLTVNDERFSPSPTSFLTNYYTAIHEPLAFTVTLSYFISYNRARRQSGFPTFISCQRQDANVLPKRRQSHQGDKLCDVSTVPLVARWPVFLARGSHADGEPHFNCMNGLSLFPLYM